MEITLDNNWITIKGLTLRPLTIPREHAAAIATAIRQELKKIRRRERDMGKIWKASEIKELRARKTSAASQAELQVRREAEVKRYHSATVTKLLRSMTAEQKRLAVQAHKRHVAACKAIGEKPESLLKFLEQYRQPEQVVSPDWDRESIREGFVRQRYDQYLSGREAA